MSEIAQTADHALRILEELGESTSLTPAELCQRLGLNRTVIHRLLRTLAARGFVLRDDGRYRLGVALVRLASAIEPDLRAIALPVMRAVADSTGETVVLHVVDGHHAVVLEQAVGTGHVVQVSHRIGSRHPLSVGASGRAILAILAAGVAAKIVEAAEHPAAVERSLEEIRNRGYALSHDELQLGVHGVAVPLRSCVTGVALGSLAILVPAGRAHDLDKYVGELRSSASNIEDKCALASINV